MNRHNCSDMLSKVFLALDGELTPEEEKVFLAEVEICSWCLEVYSIEKSFKEFLTKRVERKKVSPALIKSIKEKIKAETLG